MRSPRGVLFWERYTKGLHRFKQNTDKIPVEVVPVLMIFVGDPHMRLKRKKLGSSVDLMERRKERTLARNIEDEEEEAPLVRKGNKRAAPRKRKHAAPCSTSAPKKTKVHPYKVLKTSSFTLTSLSTCAKLFHADFCRG